MDINDNTRDIFNMTFIDYIAFGDSWQIRKFLKQKDFKSLINHFKTTGFNIFVNRLNKLPMTLARKFFKKFPQYKEIALKLSENPNADDKELLDVFLTNYFHTEFLNKINENINKFL